jgi:hypothetical protein
MISSVHSGGRFVQISFELDPPAAGASIISSYPPPSHLALM